MSTQQSSFDSTEEELPEEASDLLDTIESAATALQAADRVQAGLDEGLSLRHLAQLVGALKRLEDAAEEARKDVFEPTLDEKTEVGETVGPVRKARGSNRYIKDEDELEGAIVSRGADITDAMRFNAKDAEELLDELGVDQIDALIGESEYTYFRR